jgi:hypothetical protein
VKVDMTWDNKSQSYSYPIETTTFGFDPRANGTGTANETISAKEFGVYYNSGILHISNLVGPVRIYSISGIMIGQYPNQSQIPVNLNQGLYIVQAGNKSAKLLVTKNGYGGTTVQPVTVQPILKASPPPEINLRAGGGIKIYWNITTGNSVVPVEIAEVVNFKFTADNSIVFTLKNGTTVELENYQGIEFSIEPAPIVGINWNMTLLYCGSNYDQDGNVHYSIATKDELIVYDANKNTTTKLAINSIDDMDKFNNPQKFMMWPGSTIESTGHIGNLGGRMGIIYRIRAIYEDGSSGYEYINFNLTDGSSIAYSEIRFPNGCVIPAEIIENNGKITVKTSEGLHTF